MLQDERLIELISGSLDDALSSDETAELQAALATSADARQLLEELRQNRHGVREMPTLQAPPNLKQRVRLKVLASRPAELGRPWQKLLLMAASVALVFGVFYTFRPLKTLANTLHIRPGQLVARVDAVSEELHLAAGGAQSSHTMVAENVTAQYVGGMARVHLPCDAGKLPGGKLTVSLHFDFDGDGKVDLHTAPRLLEVDGREGYQDLVCAFPIVDGMRDMQHGKVHLQVACAEGPPLKL